MSIADVYNTLLVTLRADKRGLSCEPEEFNRHIRVVNQELFDDYVKAFEADTTSSDSLAFLKVHDYAINLAANVNFRYSYGNMPTDYYRVMGKPWVLEGSNVRFVDEVTEFEDADREGDFLTKASTTYPTCRIGGLASNRTQIKVRPHSITTVYINYLKTVAVPYLDYYTNDTTLVTTFLPETSVATNIPAGSTYRDGTAGGALVTVVPLTVDMDWDDGDLSLIIAKLMQKIGAALPDEGLQQAGVFEEQKNNA